MSGIVGILYFDGLAPNDCLTASMAALAHRGPAHAGVWACGPVSLGNRSRRVEPMPAEHEARGVAVTADACLDNRDDLTRQLGLPAGVVDGEVILAAYIRWGRACVEKLLGDFAFAVWDDGTRTLFCARDHFGVRPFYYCATDHFFAFASEINALLALPGMPRRIDETQVLDYLAGYWENGESTFYRDIRKLLPAHSLTVDAGEVRPAAYWSLGDPLTLKLKSDDDYADAFRAHFLEAVRCRARGGVIGSTLSGGLDSSSIACAAHNELRNRSVKLSTFSLIFDDVPKSDERQYMQAVIDTGGFDAHMVRGDLVSPLHEIDLILAQVGQPFLGPNLFLHRAMYQAAQAAGVDVILDGFDGDSTVSHGLSRLTELSATGRWITLVKEARAVSRQFGIGTRTILRNFAVYPLLPTSMRKSMAGAGMPVTLNPDFRRRSRFEDRPELSEPELKPARTERESHRRRLTWTPLDRALSIADTSNFFGLEGRYPFFDVRLVEFCFSLPADQKLRNGWTRWVMRNGMEGILPSAVQWRKDKSNLGHNFLHTLQTHDVETIRSTIGECGNRLAEYVDIDAFKAQVEDFVANKKSLNAQSIMQITALSRWLSNAGM